MSAVNRFMIPGRQPVRDLEPETGELPLEYIDRALQGRQVAYDALDQRLQETKGLYKDLPYGSWDAEAVENLNNELQSDVNNFYSDNKDLSSPEARRHWYDLVTKYQSDDRALNISSNFNAYKKAKEDWEKSVRETGNQSYNSQRLYANMKSLEEHGTYGRGEGFSFKNNPNLFQDPGYTKYMSDKEIREQLEPAVNDMMASSKEWVTGQNGEWLYTHKEKGRGEEQINNALEPNKVSFLNSLAGENLILS